MRRFERLRSVAVPVDMVNVDTDRIIPARFLTRKREMGLGTALFHDVRFDEAGQARPDVTLNQPAYAGARILVADDNFGCGSSREAAVWALADAHGAVGDGFLSIIAPSFGDIFYNNACKNGLLPVRLPAPACTALRAALYAAPGAEVSVDLARQRVTFPDGSEHGFEIDPYRKTCLVQGLDDIDLTLLETERIAAYEARTAEQEPWRALVSG